MGTTINYQMYASDITSIAAASSYTTVSNEIDVGDAEIIAVQVKGTGAAAGNADLVTAKFTVSIDGTNFDTVIYQTASVQMSGTVEQRATTLINVSGVKKIRVESVENEDSTNAVSNVNVYLGKTLI